MKKQILFLTILLSCTCTISQAGNIELGKKETTDPTRPRAPMLIPVTVDLSLTDLYLNFWSTVGIADIVITDSNGTIVYMETMDTETTAELYIAIENWDSGDYSIEISYGSKTLIGNFTLD